MSYSVLAQQALLESGAHEQSAICIARRSSYGTWPINNVSQDLAHRVPSKTPAHAHTSHTRAYALPWRYAQNCACRNFDYTQPGQLHFMAVQALILWSVQEEDLESIRATTGVRATVGGKRSGEAALWHTYAMLALPTLLLAAPEFSPTRWSAAATLTPREMPT